MVSSKLRAFAMFVHGDRARAPAAARGRTPAENRQPGCTVDDRARDDDAIA